MTGDQAVHLMEKFKREATMNNDAKSTAVPNEPQETGFPWLLVIQILLTILSYMASRANTKPERDRFLHLHTELSYWKENQ